MADFDIYDDLDDLHAREKEKAAEEQQWKEKYQAALVTIEKLQTEKKELSKKVKQLETNFSSLLETARAEIKRKDNQIADLRREKDDICFRRNVRPARSNEENDRHDISHIVDRYPAPSSSRQCGGLSKKEFRNEDRSRDRSREGRENPFKQKRRENESSDRSEFKSGKSTTTAMNPNKPPNTNDIEGKPNNRTEKTATCGQKTTTNSKTMTAIEEEILRDVKKLKKRAMDQAEVKPVPEQDQKLVVEKSNEFFDAVFDDMIENDNPEEDELYADLDHPVSEHKEENGPIESVSAVTATDGGDSNSLEPKLFTPPKTHLSEVFNELFGPSPGSSFKPSVKRKNEKDDDVPPKQKDFVLIHENMQNGLSSASKEELPSSVTEEIKGNKLETTLAEASGKSGSLKRGRSRSRSRDRSRDKGRGSRHDHRSKSSRDRKDRDDKRHRKEAKGRESDKHHHSSRRAYDSRDHRTRESHHSKKRDRDRHRRHSRDQKVYVEDEKKTQKPPDMIYEELSEGEDIDIDSIPEDKSTGKEADKHEEQVNEMEKLVVDDEAEEVEVSVPSQYGEHDRDATEHQSIANVEPTKEEEKSDEKEPPLQEESAGAREQVKENIPNPTTEQIKSIEAPPQAAEDELSAGKAIESIAQDKLLSDSVEHIVHDTVGIELTNEEAAAEKSSEVDAASEEIKENYNIEETPGQGLIESKEQWCAEGNVEFDPAQAVSNDPEDSKIQSTPEADTLSKDLAAERPVGEDCFSAKNAIDSDAQDELLSDSGEHLKIQITPEEETLNKDLATERPVGEDCLSVKKAIDSCAQDKLLSDSGEHLAHAKVSVELVKGDSSVEKSPELSRQDSGELLGHKQEIEAVEPKATESLDPESMAAQPTELSSNFETQLETIVQEQLPSHNESSGVDASSMISTEEIPQLTGNVEPLAAKSADEEVSNQKPLESDVSKQQEADAETTSDQERAVRASDDKVLDPKSHESLMPNGVGLKPSVDISMDEKKSTDVESVAKVNDAKETLDKVPDVSPALESSVEKSSVEDAQNSHVAGDIEPSNHTTEVAKSESVQITTEKSLESGNDTSNTVISPTEEAPKPTNNEQDELQSESLLSKEQISQPGKNESFESKDNPPIVDALDPDSVCNDQSKQPTEDNEQSSSSGRRRKLKMPRKVTEVGDVMIAKVVSGNHKPNTESSSSDGDTRSIEAPMADKIIPPSAKSVEQRAKPISPKKVVEKMEKTIAAKENPTSSAPLKKIRIKTELSSVKETILPASSVAPSAIIPKCDVKMHHKKRILHNSVASMSVSSLIQVSNDSPDKTTTESAATSAQKQNGDANHPLVTSAASNTQIDAKRKYKTKIMQAFMDSDSGSETHAQNTSGPASDDLWSPRSQNSLNFTVSPAAAAAIVTNVANKKYKKDVLQYLSTPNGALNIGVTENPNNNADGTSSTEPTSDEKQKRSDATAKSKTKVPVSVNRRKRKILESYAKDQETASPAKIKHLALPLQENTHRVVTPDSTESYVPDSHESPPKKVDVALAPVSIVQSPKKETEQSAVYIKRKTRISRANKKRKLSPEPSPIESIKGPKKEQEIPLNAYDGSQLKTKSKRSASLEKSLRCTPETTPTHHTIFQSDVSPRSQSSALPSVYNVSEDSQFQEIDKRMRSLFQSPTYSNDTSANASDLKENITISETTGSHSEKSLCDTSSSSRKVSLGSCDYIIETVGSHTANVFIRRKKCKKRMKVAVATT